MIGQHRTRVVRVFVFLLCLPMLVACVKHTEHLERQQYYEQRSDIPADNAIALSQLESYNAFYNN